jgi:uncharacterized protein (TIGR02328 family)
MKERFNMRLWHYTLLPYLPKSQLIAQKRECDLIWKDLFNGKQTNHILINYIWSYHQPDIELYQYYTMLADEFDRRGFKFNFSEYINEDYYRITLHPFANHHNNQYLIQCFYNLQEKADCGIVPIEQFNRVLKTCEIYGIS